MRRDRRVLSLALALLLFGVSASAAAATRKSSASPRLFARHLAAGVKRLLQGIGLTAREGKERQPATATLRGVEQYGSAGWVVTQAFAESPAELVQLLAQGNHGAVREGVVRFLARDPRLIVQAEEAASGSAANETVRQRKGIPEKT